MWFYNIAEVGRGSDRGGDDVRKGDGWMNDKDGGGGISLSACH